MLVIARVSGTVVPVRVGNDCVFHEKTVVFPDSDFGSLGLLTSVFHWLWAYRWSSTLGGLGNLNYSPTDVFETLVPPENLESSIEIVEAMRELESMRADLMRSSNQGLTKIYKRFHDSDDMDEAVEGLRRLHEQLDYAVAHAYGWTDLELDHHHWEMPQGMRFSVSKAARDQILDRLLELNHERHANEVASGVGGKTKNGGGAKKSSSSPNSAQGSLL